MDKYPSAFKSLLNQKCPQCRSEKVFKHKTFSTSFLKMHQRCPHCDANLNPEPGFYWGAMYISYGFSAGIAITVSFILYFFLGNPIMEYYILAVLSVNFALFTVMIRYSRLVMLYWLGELKFKPNFFKKN